MRRPPLPTALPRQTALASELRRSDLAHHLQRLHAVLLVAAGQSTVQVAGWLGLSPRTVERWTQAYELQGVVGLRTHHGGGRPAALSQDQWQQLQAVVRQSPGVSGYGQRRWSGKLLALHLAQHHDLQRRARHCQRLLFRRVDGPP